MCSIPPVRPLRETKHSHLQLGQAPETLKEPLRQGDEGVVAQVPSSVEGTHNEPRRDGQLAIRNFLLPYPCTTVDISTSSKQNIDQHFRKR